MTLKLFLIKLTSLFELRKSLLNNKTGYNSKTISALDFKLHKLIQCLKMTLYNMFHNSEINIHQIMSPFGLKTSYIKSSINQLILTELSPLFWT